MAINSMSQSFGGINSSLLLNKKEETGKPIIVKFSEQILHVALSPFVETHDLAVIVFKKEIAIVSLTFREEEKCPVVDQPVYCKLLQKLNTMDEIYRIGWCPDSSLTTAPYCVTFACTRTNNSGIQIFTTNITDEYSDKILFGHSNYVNDVAYEPSGDYLASVSDDLTCKIWDVKEDYKLSNTFHLLSFGVSVIWHKTNPGLLVVGEKLGTVRMYNVTRGVALLSFQSDIGNLTTIDWLSTQSGHGYIAALCGHALVVWNTSSPSVAQSCSIIHPQGGRHVCFIPGVNIKIFSIGSPDNTLKRTLVNKANTKPITSFKLVSNISCHVTLPYIAIGVDNTLQLWNTQDL